MKLGYVHYHLLKDPIHLKEKLGVMIDPIFLLVIMRQLLYGMANQKVQRIQTLDIKRIIMEELIERLRHYYEIDLDNCEMTQEDWITELAKAMYYDHYKEKFIEQHEEYKKIRL